MVDSESQPSSLDERRAAAPPVQPRPTRAVSWIAMVAVGLVVSAVAVFSLIRAGLFNLSDEAARRAASSPRASNQ